MLPVQQPGYSPGFVLITSKRHMAIAYIALGSNLGDRWGTLSAATRRLRAEPGTRVVAESKFYETIPVDCPPGSGTFLNAVIAIATDREPEDVLALLLRIERGFGRIRSELNSPRTLDLDLILYGDRTIHTPNLIVPHARMHERDFVLIPLAEIAPDVVHPVSGKTIRELAASLPPTEVRPAQQPMEMNTFGLRGQRALVTGSTSGIGASIAQLMEQHGAEVIRHGRSSLPNATKHYLAANLGEPSQVDRLAEQAWDLLEGLDILVLNAGADTLTGDAAKWSFEDKLEALLAVDLKSTMRLSRAIGARMKERGHGTIITIGWDQAETGMEGDSGQLFAGVKGGIMCFTRSLALSLAPEVRVNCIAPGWIRTAWGETASPAWQDRVQHETPLGIWGLPFDVAVAAVWLASPVGRFITGQTIRVNGGVIRV